MRRDGSAGLDDRYIEAHPGLASGDVEQPTWEPDPPTLMKPSRLTATDPTTGLGLSIVTYGHSWSVNVSGELAGVSVVSVASHFIESRDAAMVAAVAEAARLYAAGLRPRLEPRRSIAARDDGL